MEEDSLVPASIRILLIDDEVLVRAGTAMMLDELGHSVVEASSGKEGLERLAEDDAITVLITDYNMPDMHGLDVIETAKQLRPGLIAILMTGYSAKDSRFVDIGVERLEKPFGLDALEQVLKESCK